MKTLFVYYSPSDGLNYSLCFQRKKHGLLWSVQIKDSICPLEILDVTADLSLSLSRHDLTLTLQFFYYDVAVMISYVCNFPITASV